jgi:uncharacterized protein YndB with AHSA1/START domain
VSVDVRTLKATGDAIVKEVTYPHPPDVVWAAITDPAAIGRWLMPNDFEPTVGHRFQFRTKPQLGWNGVVDARVLEVDAPRRLSYSWAGGWGSETTVTFTLAPGAGGSTILRLEHTGFAAGGFRGRMLKQILARGWGSRILGRNLPEELDRGVTMPTAA